MRHLNAAGGQFVTKPYDGQMRCLAQALKDERTMGFKDRLAVAAHLARAHIARATEQSGPFDGGRLRNTKTIRRRPAAIAGKNRFHNAFTKIIRIRFHHAC